MPRPRFVNVIDLITSIEQKDPKAQKDSLQRFDKDLENAVSKDMANYIGMTISSISFRGKKTGINSIRKKHVFSRFGWCEVRYPYRVGSTESSDVFKYFNINRKMTPFASDIITRLSVTLGSYKEAADTIELIGCGKISISKLRTETICIGEEELLASRNPPMDIRYYSKTKLKTPKDAHQVEPTLVIMSDGTNVPCVKTDTVGIRGKNSEQAKSRQIRIVSGSEYIYVTNKGIPIPIKGSFSYAVTDLGIEDFTSLIHNHAVARGSGTVLRVQCVADGEEALEKAMRDALPFAEFTNDFMHASSYLNTCCEKLGIDNHLKEYKTCRSIMLRHGAGSVVDRIKRLYTDKLATSKESRDALNYLDKRRNNMRYGWLRKNGYYISSCHIEAAARILVARRCKQAGMHWRHHNVACVCAIIAKIRSAQ